MKLRVMTVKEAYECERAYMLSRERRDAHKAKFRSYPDKAA